MLLLLHLITITMKTGKILYKGDKETLQVLNQNASNLSLHKDLEISNSLFDFDSSDPAGVKIKLSGTGNDKFLNTNANSELSLGNDASQLWDLQKENESHKLKSGDKCLTVDKGLKMKKCENNNDRQRFIISIDDADNVIDIHLYPSNLHNQPSKDNPDDMTATDDRFKVEYQPVIREITTSSTKPMTETSTVTKLSVETIHEIRTVDSQTSITETETIYQTIKVTTTQNSTVTSTISTPTQHPESLPEILQHINNIATMMDSVKPTLSSPQIKRQNLHQKYKGQIDPPRFIKGENDRREPHFSPNSPTRRRNMKETDDSDDDSESETDDDIPRKYGYLGKKNNHSLPNKCVRKDVNTRKVVNPLQKRNKAGQSEEESEDSSKEESDDKSDEDNKTEPGMCENKKETISTIKEEASDSSMTNEFDPLSILIDSFTGKPRQQDSPGKKDEIKKKKKKHNKVVALVKKTISTIKQKPNYNSYSSPSLPTTTPQGQQYYIPGATGGY